MDHSTDLKTAMRAKDTNRLNVLRSVLAEITNASKTNNPPTSDLHILQIIKKARTKSATSASEFAAAGRQDLADKENGQISVLDEYAGQVATIEKEELQAAVQQVMAKLEKVNVGDVIKGVMALMEGKPVVKSELAQVVKEAIVGKK